MRLNPPLFFQGGRYTTPSMPPMVLRRVGYTTPSMPPMVLRREGGYIPSMPPMVLRREGGYTLVYTTRVCRRVYTLVHHPMYTPWVYPVHTMDVLYHAAVLTVWTDAQRGSPGLKKEESLG